MKRSLSLLLLLLATVCVGGCAHFRPGAADDETDLPWNAPAGWESQTLGVPY